MTLPRVIFVTGKGGTGKSTAAAALTLAHRGPATLIDLDRRASAIKVVSAVGGAAPHTERSIELLALTPRGELEAFIQRIVPLQALARRMLRSRTFSFVATALPGLEAFLILERIRLLATTIDTDRLIVVDGPATGGTLELLNVPGGVQRLAPLGTLHRLAADVEKFVRSPDHFGVLLTTSPEQLVLRETLEAKAALDALGVGCVGAVLNQCQTALFTEGEVRELAGLDGYRRIAQARRQAGEATVAAKRHLRQAGLNPIGLPMLYRPALGTAEIVALAKRLEEGLLSR
jgi:anion-transporting  ArsA/GET3 family ATPase